MGAPLPARERVTSAIIIPTYNRAEMVGQAIESALAQHPPARVVVVDDGSTDDTPGRLAAYRDRILIHRQENTERGAARNRGASLVPQADSLLFLDADDLLAPGHLAALQRALGEHPGASFIASGGWDADEELNPIRRLPTKPGPIAIEPFLRGREPVSLAMCLVPRAIFEAVGGFPEDRALSGSEDWLLAARLLLQAPGIRIAEESLLIRKHPGNSMANAESMERSMLLAHERLFSPGGSAPSHGRPSAPAVALSLPLLEPPLATPPLPLPLALRGPSRANLLYRSAIGYYVAGDMGRARGTLAQAIRTDPAILADPRTSWLFLRTLLGRELSSRLRARKGLRVRRAALRAPTEGGEPEGPLGEGGP